MVKKATGRDPVLDGPISLSILPTPTVDAERREVLQRAGVHEPQHGRGEDGHREAVAARALLTSSLEVSEVTLVEPKIVLEINAERQAELGVHALGRRGPSPPPPSLLRPSPCSLGRLTIDNGTLIFSDSKAGLSVVAEKANFSASVRSLDGPYSLAGAATINGAPLKLDLSVGAKGADGHATDLSPSKPAAS